ARCPIRRSTDCWSGWVSGPSLDGEDGRGLERQALRTGVRRRGGGKQAGREDNRTMAKKRVYELAKDLGLSNKEMVDWLKAHEYDVKSHSSSLEDDQALAVV